MKLSSLFNLILSCSAINTFINAELGWPEFEIANKLSIPIEFDLSSENTTDNKFRGPSHSNMKTIEPGETRKIGEMYVEEHNPQMLFREKNKPEMAILYEFQGANKLKKIHIKVEPTKGGLYKIVPQTTALMPRIGNIKQEHIKVVGTRGISPELEAERKKRDAAWAKEVAGMADKSSR